MGLPRDELSRRGDDGSLRLLAVPAVLVVVVLFFLVTACSGAGGEESGVSGDGSGESTAVASDDTGGVDDDEGGVGDGDGDGDARPVLPAEITDDGRMIQPEGHKGIWFETAPGDPLGKLVYESQRFVGDPVELEPLGDRALMPEWAEMPDLCTGEVLVRMNELELRNVDHDATPVDLGVVSCGVVGEGRSGGGGILDESFIWTIYDGKYREKTDIFGASEKGTFYEILVGGNLAENMGCVSINRGLPGGYELSASHLAIDVGDNCRGSEYSLQVVMNVVGLDYV
ncbi:hypothetical protein [Candidatus Corynebacterium faecigallinarum]|uniref:hypothetical protein n=1 Tax=Candidatus Corynebacterium faecigallinarum TaxID=2838528 RepID=UPI003FD13A04